MLLISLGVCLKKEMDQMKVIEFINMFSKLTDEQKQRELVIQCEDSAGFALELIEFTASITPSDLSEYPNRIYVSGTYEL